MAASRYICLICRNPLPHAGAECPHCKSQVSAAVGVTPRLLAAVFGVMAALFVLTGYFNGAFNRERFARAEKHYALAQTYMDYGYHDAAVEQYRDALHYRRDTFEYRLGLALALYRSKRFQEAELQLIELRTVDPTHAVVNRLLARLARRAGRFQEALSHYRTAIYGRWPRGGEENRRETRLELIEMLRTAGLNSLLVGELLTLLEEDSPSEQTRKYAGMLFLEAGAPEQAARVLRGLVEAGRRDPETLAALGQAELETGAFASALTRFEEALRSGPDVDVRRQRDLAAEVLSIDPAARGITSFERHRRSRALLERTLKYLEGCANPLGSGLIGPPPPLDSRVEAAFEEAREVLQEQGRPDDWDAAIETNIALAERLWGLRRRVCTSVWDEDLALITVIRSPRQ